MSISDSTLSVAICDQHAFYPFRALVAGGVASWEHLDQAEQFVRTVLLHDYVEMDGEPHRAPPEEQEWTEEEIAAGRRMVITSFMPTLNGYEDVVRSQLGPTRELNLELSPRLVNLAASSAGTDQVDDPYFRWVRLFFVGGPETSRRGCEQQGKSYLTRRRRGEEGDGGGSLTGGAIPSA